jgi:DNA-binding CsgD family transcriptional regulator
MPGIIAYPEGKVNLTSFDLAVLLWDNRPAFQNGAAFMSQDLPGVLSEREIEILRLVAQGLANKEIGRELSISANTVKVHLRNVFNKLEVNSRTEATMVAVRQGWVAVDRGAPESEAVARPAAEDSDASPRPVTPIASWQRIFLLAALVAVVAALAWTWPTPAPAEKTLDNPLVDSARSVALAGLPDLPSRWKEEVPTSVARGRLAVVAVDGFIYAMGGETPGGVTGVVEVYDPLQRTWTLGEAKPVPVANVDGAVLDGRIYVPGGSVASDQVTNVMEVYDPRADRWEQAARLPGPRAAYALAVHGDKLYLFGGTDGQRDVDSVLVYDPATDGWQTGRPMPAARAFAGAATLDGRIYVVGGYSGGRELDTCQVYVPEETRWESCAPMLEGRGGLGLVAVGRALYAIGGGWEGHLVYNQWYDLDRQTWLRFETPVSGQWRNAGAAEVGGKVYVVGGWSDEFLNLNLAYQATYKSFIPSVSR